MLLYQLNDVEAYGGYQTIKVFFNPSLTVQYVELEEDYQQIFNRFIDSLNILGLLMPEAPKPPAQDAGFKDCGSILRINTRSPPPLFLRPVFRMNIEKAAQSAHENRPYFPIS